MVLTKEKELGARVMGMDGLMAGLRGCRKR